MEPEHLTSLLSSEIIGFILSLFGCALFSFLETSVTALRLFKLKELARSAPRYKRLLTALEEHPEQILVTILIANSLVNVTAAALITTIMEQVFAAFNLSSGLGFSLGIGIGSMFMLLFGEVIPKSIAKVHGEKLFKSTLWITNIAYYLLYPFVRLLIHVSNLFVGLVGGKTASDTDSVTSEHEIRFLIDYIGQKGLIETEKTEMLHSVFNLGRKPVREIMVPDSDIKMISSKVSLTEALAEFTKYQFSRLPVYEETHDNVIGMIYQKDVVALITRNEQRSLEEIVRPILFVPESMKINQLLREFRNQRMHIAMVINEYGSITGLVTLEDVLEEIVGEISDEYEEITPKVVPLEDGGWLVDATIDLATLQQILKIDFEVEDAVTLGGFVMEQLQRLPKKGERILYKGYYFQVQKASHKRINQVLIFKDVPALPGEKAE